MLDSNSDWKQWIYERTAKPFLLSLDPEIAHSIAHRTLRFSTKVPILSSVLENLTSYSSERLKTKVAGLEFENPVGLAAGFDKTGELYPFLSGMGFGFIEVGTITGQPQAGNPKPRVFRYPEDQALINRMGFNNPGADKAAATIGAQRKTIIRGINVGKTKVVPEDKAVEDYLYSIQKLSSFADYLVINVSSPNTPGLRNFQKQENLFNLMNGIRNGLGGEFPSPTFVKFAPDLEERDFEEIMESVPDLRISGVILTNTTIDKSVIKKFPNVELEGGVSGAPLRARSTRFVRLAYQKLRGKIPIIGVGGVDSGEAALEKILAGADLIQVYTGYIYQGPLLPRRILEYLDKTVKKFGAKSISEIVGQGSL
ncbi:dihydroorotate dehydrogenase (fumarate) [Leptospira inadai serovar Lyme str. 10]|uniref:Dihydroorotate dehydrogenase (quinone) n=2 Tax=Leptospira inadai serovar Lyme TaxID=293084 RepID=V6HGU1_9LEPT|nr:quinone-dependent dihydroorotate dehydrogenase [Leptospira inadai]EQA34890.1 dihydroorotate dehydrogenase (fumarate) [Leptospira inadai serovar Lyme str. 10]PNV75377.1 quinone-dependent dihydroorotate dehydrogenase [Leptospira inadai serovar Lyme]